jgi:GNAT superfamily N-acetyltransferase
VIRDYRPEDGPAVVELLRRLESLWPVTVASLVDDDRRQQAEAMRRVWVADGGYAVARRLWEQQPAGSAMVWVGVVPERRRRGLGSALLEAALGHLVAVGGVDQACSADEPGVDIQWSFEEFERTELGRPTLDHDGSFVALADGAPVAMSIIFRAGPVAHNGFTCTHPDWRGRGLATLVKTAALRHAFEQGAERVATMNDAENPPMLRVNERLGYRPVRPEAQLQLPLTERTSGVPSSQSTTLTEQ